MAKKRLQNPSPAPYPGSYGKRALYEKTFPVANLGFWPTPLHPLSRLSEHLGGNVEIYVKRDDCSGLAFGGNKVRKLELLMGEALSEGADVIITVGAPQSNHVRMTAAAARLFGLDTHVVLGGEPPTSRSGNLLLDHLLGAHAHFANDDAWPVLEREAEELADRLRADGYHPFTIPIGGSTPLGALGFVSAFGEMAAQARASELNFDAIVTASSSGGTHAGLALGCHLQGTPTRVIGMGTAKTPTSLRDDVSRLLRGASELLGRNTDAAAAVGVEVCSDYMGEAYAVPTPAALEAIRLLATTESILLDPVYSAKAIAGLIDWVRKGRFPKGSKVLFWHTGGNVALFANAYSGLLGET